MASEDQSETRYPLRLLACESCWLVQTDIDLFRMDADEVFAPSYPYYSSSHPAFVAHAKQYAGRMVERLGLNEKSLVIEIGSNDGYLLQHFKDRGIRVLGIEPTQTAQAAEAKGIRTVQAFFDEAWVDVATALHGEADLVVCNNVLAHVPDITGFCRGVKRLLRDGAGGKPAGVATFEFPSLRNLVEGGQWDTVYHEHYSYLSFTTARDIMKDAGMLVFDVEHIPTHGGSLRVIARSWGGRLPGLAGVIDEVFREQDAGVRSGNFYAGMQAAADQSAKQLREFLESAKRDGKKVAGFGAAAKGNTLLNYAEIDDQLLPYIVDDTPAKQGKFAPGSRIPIFAEFVSAPDYILVLPWNWLPQIKHRLAPLLAAGSKLVTAVPTLKVH